MDDGAVDRDREPVVERELRELRLEVRRPLDEDGRWIDLLDQLADQARGLRAVVADAEEVQSRCHRKWPRAA